MGCQQQARGRYLASSNKVTLLSTQKANQANVSPGQEITAGAADKAAGRRVGVCHMQYSVQTVDTLTQAF